MVDANIFFLLTPSIIFEVSLSPSPSLDVTHICPGLQSGASSPLPTTVRAFSSIARRCQLFPRRLASNSAYPRCEALSAVDIDARCQ